MIYLDDDEHSQIPSYTTENTRIMHFVVKLS